MTTAKKLIAIIIPGVISADWLELFASCHARLLGFAGLPGSLIGLCRLLFQSWFGSKLISVLRRLNTTDATERQMSCQSRRAILPRHAIGVVAVLAQKLGVGGTGVDEASALPPCARPLGTVALVEEKAKSDPCMDGLPPQFRVMMEMAKSQRGEGQSVDPMPLVKLLAARSRCFTIVDRGAGYHALQRERAIAAGQGGGPISRSRANSAIGSPQLAVTRRFDCLQICGRYDHPFIRPCFRLLAAKLRVLGLEE